MRKATVNRKEGNITEALYNSILKPVITEKATMASEHNKVVFNVPLSANKVIIKDAVEAIFKVKVEKINTSVLKGKTKMFKGRKGVRNDTKKAVVTLAEGETIDIATGI